MYNHAAADGMWTGPYSSGGDSHEGILRNTFSLKNAVGMLNESRSTGGTTRPAEGTQLANRNRKSYVGLWEIFQTIEYYRPAARDHPQRRRGVDRVALGERAAAPAVLRRHDDPDVRGRQARDPRVVPVAELPARRARAPTAPTPTRSRCPRTLVDAAVRLLPDQRAVLRPAHRRARSRCGWSCTASRRRRGRPGTSSGWRSRCAG